MSQSPANKKSPSSSTAKKTATSTSSAKKAVSKATAKTSQTRAASAGKVSAASAKTSGKSTTRSSLAPAGKLSAKKPAARKHAASKLAPSKQAPSKQALSKPTKAAGNKGLPKRQSKPADRLKATIMKAIEELKAKDVVVIDVRGRTSVTDELIIATGTSTRHVKSIADNVVIKSKAIGIPPIGVEGESGAEWVLVDLGDYVVHVMQAHVREFYALEKLWSAPIANSDDTNP